MTDHEFARKTGYYFQNQSRKDGGFVGPEKDGALEVLRKLAVLL
jgi:hypothetical protein